MTMNEMMTAYNAHSAAHSYALGFIHDKKLYVVKMNYAELSRYFKLDRASSKRGGFAKIRIRMTAKDRAMLSDVAELLGSADLLVKDTKYNKGDNFERELTERWTSETWVKNSVPFWQAGDIRVNGIEIQVKLDSAELTNEKILSTLA